MSASPCPKCQGACGLLLPQVGEEYVDFLKVADYQWDQCEECKGRGVIEVECESCGGMGVHHNKE